VNPKLKELRGKVEKLRQELAQIIQQAGPDMDMSKVTVIDGDSTTKVAYMRAINQELDEAMKQAEPLEAEQAAITRSREQLKKFGEPLTEHPGFSVGDTKDGWQGTETQNLGKSFTEAWTAMAQAKDKDVELDFGPNPIKATMAVGLKTTLTEAAGWAPQAIRTGQVIPFATRPIQLLDLLPGGNTTQSAIVYMEETTFTPAAAETAEGSAFPEAALAYTERNVPVRKIPVFIPVTDEQLEDVGQVQGLLNQRLPFFVMQRLDGQILNGNGTAPNLFGILNVSGIQTQARGTDPAPDAAYKALVKCRVTGRANPNAFIFHPTDWQNIRLLRTADGIYIFGNPSDPGPDRLWGLPVAQSDAGSAGTAVAGDFAGFSQLVERRGITIKVSDSHSDFFIKGTQAIRADYRCAIVWYRPAAFTTITGL
jgi:HK97 family phage major capsid protein